MYQISVCIDYALHVIPLLCGVGPELHHCLYPLLCGVGLELHHCLYPLLCGVGLELHHCHYPGIS